MAAIPSTTKAFVSQGDISFSRREIQQSSQQIQPSVVPVQASNGGPWGTWHAWVYCLPGSYMNAYQIKYDHYNGLGMSTDDFGITHLKLFCVYPNASEANNMIVGVNDNNPPGAWEDVQVCPEGKWLKTWMQAVTPSLGSDDDDARNNIVFYCSSDASGRSDVGKGKAAFSGALNGFFGILGSRAEIKGEIGMFGQRLLGTGDGRYAQSSTVTCPSRPYLVV
ncbi:vitelline membrane outer layer protein 1 homolog [Penaeus monodon]|uniref:vitelline membrane outer layer protein 1 homolog n=1 Tax=Penaeus monodon TaxID=6687 RepID=UPI0018A6F30B|nr:vitelline membrane outer layer protein 1 homolog [Penaeus monodon]